jgi:hypothetical protein
MAGAAFQPTFGNVDFVVTSPGSHHTILPPVPSATPPPAQATLTFDTYQNWLIYYIALYK